MREGEKDEDGMGMKLKDGERLILAHFSAS